MTDTGYVAHVRCTSCGTRFHVIVYAKAPDDVRVTVPPHQVPGSRKRCFCLGADVLSLKARPS